MPHILRGVSFFKYSRSDPYSFIVKSEITTKQKGCDDDFWEENNIGCSEFNIVTSPFTVCLHLCYDTLLSVFVGEKKQPSR